MMQKNFSCIPIVGATKLSQLEENLKTVDVVVPEEDIKHLDEVSKINLGFPGDFLKRKV